MADRASELDLEHGALGLRLAPVGGRIVALWIDSVVLFPMLVTLWLDVDLTLVLVAAQLWFLVYTVAGWSRWWGGQTVGMRVMRIRVLRSDGSSLGPRRALARYLVLAFSWMLLGLPLLLVAATKRRQTLHDVVTDTIVVAA